MEIEEGFKVLGKLVVKSDLARKWRLRKLLKMGDRAEDKRIWSKELEPHAFGSYSFAAVQGGTVMEDFSQVDVSKRATFIGIYDGHGGDITASHISKTLLGHLIDHVQTQTSVSEQILKDAITDTETRWINFARESLVGSPDVTKAGACCLIGLIWNGMLYVGNLGDSRAVMGRTIGTSNKHSAEQITEDHNVNLVPVHKQSKDSPGIASKLRGIIGCIYKPVSHQIAKVKVPKVIKGTQKQNGDAPIMGDEKGGSEIITGQVTEDPKVKLPNVNKDPVAKVKLVKDGMGDNLATVHKVKGVMGERGKFKVVADQITEDHNVNIKKIREELQEKNKDDPQIVAKVNGVWLVRGITQISRSIGDLQLKMQEFAADSKNTDNSKKTDDSKDKSLIRPALSGEPFVTSRALGRDVRFVVFASRGLWENLSSEEVVKIVNKKARSGIAKKLVAAAMTEATINKKPLLKDDNLPDTSKEYDDITVAVVFFDAEPKVDTLQEGSVKALQDNTTPSELRRLEGEIQTE